MTDSSKYDSVKLLSQCENLEESIEENMTQHETSEEQGDTAENDSEPSYGWFGYKPRCLQPCLSPRWILFSCCWLVFAESFIVSGLSGVVVSSLEKRYFLRSSQVGGIYATYEVTGIIVALVISYFGHTHKPRWLGVGSLVLGFGCLTFALPQLLAGRYEPVIARDTDLCRSHNLTSLNGAANADEETCKKSSWYHLMVFVLGELLIGAGASPIYNLGLAYLDENVSRKNSGLYLGVFYAVSTLGPGLGFLLGGYFLRIYVDISLPEGVHLKQNDSSWIGAWWLGYIFAGALALLVSIPLLGFPREIPGVKHLSEQKRKAVDTVRAEHVPRTARQFLPTLKSLLTNKVFLFTTIASTPEGLAVSGIGTFFPKFLESQFHLSSSDASFYAGMVIILGGILGMLLGGYFIRRFQWTCAQCIKACTIIGFLALFPILILLVHCPNEALAGVTTPYYFNRTRYDSLDFCSNIQNCSCKQYKYIPICTKEDHTTYFSPCHAGCKTKTRLGGDLVYTNCSCLPSNITVAYDGGCDQSCNAMGYFLAIMFVLIVFTFFNNIPAITVILRCVPENQGSFAIGVQQVITKIFAFTPGPIIYGALLDSVCILSRTDPCEDKERNCLEYRNEGLSYVFFAASMVCKVTSISFFALAWLVYKPPNRPPENMPLNVAVNECDTSDDLAIS